MGVRLDDDEVKRVLELVRLGYSNRAIERLLSISEITVRRIRKIHGLAYTGDSKRTKRYRASALKRSYREAFEAGSLTEIKTIRMHLATARLGWPIGTTYREARIYQVLYDGGPLTVSSLFGRIFPDAVWNPRSKFARRVYRMAKQGQLTILNSEDGHRVYALPAEVRARKAKLESFYAAD